MEPRIARRGQVIKASLLVGSFFVLACGSANAATFCVGTAAELASALQTAAANGANDVIRVVQGTYQGSFVYDSSEAFDLAIEGGYVEGCASNRLLNPTNTVLDAGNAGTVLTVMSTGWTIVVVDGLTLQHGRATSGAAGLSVPCCINNQVSLTLRDSIVRQNTLLATSGSWGTGGLGYSGPGTLIAVDNIIEENFSNSEGGGVQVNGGSNIIIANNTIRNNSGGPGGACM